MKRGRQWSLIDLTAAPGRLSETGAIKAAFSFGVNQSTDSYTDRYLLDCRHAKRRNLSDSDTLVVGFISEGIMFRKTTETNTKLGAFSGRKQAPEATRS